MIRLVGPGGAGKTTIGLALATRMGRPFIDLDRQFTALAGDISVYINEHGYSAYVSRNIQVYLGTLGSLDPRSVFALSSGFMAYGNDSHLNYQCVYREIVSSPSTVALLPSFDYETCVAEIVRRQLTRPSSRSAEREEQVIRTRFEAYRRLPVKKVETMNPVDAVVENLLLHLMPIWNE